MALSNPRCLATDHKRDFDLKVVLDSFRDATIAPDVNVPTGISSTTIEQGGNKGQTVPGSLLHQPFDGNFHSGYCHSSNNSSVAAHQDSTEAATVVGYDDVGKMQPCHHPSGSYNKRESDDTDPNEISYGQTVTCNYFECVDVKLVDYLTAFRELTRFFKLTGPVFAFVAHDLTKKIGLLQNHLDSASGNEYQTLTGMLNHELSRGVTGDRKSGARTFLRLHWALEFFIEFMDQLKDVESDVKTSSLVYGVYQATLAAHHPWWTRKLAYLAVFTLPSLKVLIDIMCKQDYSEVKVLLAQVVEIGKPILKCVSAVYKSHNISNIH